MIVWYLKIEKKGCHRFLKRTLLPAIAWKLNSGLQTLTGPRHFQKV